MPQLPTGPLVLVIFCRSDQFSCSVDIVVVHNLPFGILTSKAVYSAEGWWPQTPRPDQDANIQHSGHLSPDLATRGK